MLNWDGNRTWTLSVNMLAVSSKQCSAYSSLTELPTQLYALSDRGQTDAQKFHRCSPLWLYIFITTPLIRLYADTLLYHLFVWTVIQQTWMRPAGMQLREALMKRWLPQIYLCYICSNVETRCYGAHCFALPATVRLCPTHLPLGLWTVLDEGSSHLRKKIKTNLKAGRGSRKESYLWMVRAQREQRRRTGSNSTELCLKNKLEE